MKQDFSVLMSVYKNEKPEFLKSCLYSIVNQSLKPTELIIVKDGTLNKGLDNILEEFSNSNDFFYIFGYEQNRGVGYALSFGLAKCNHEIIIRCDSDDINKLDRFKTQIEFINKNNYAIIGSNIEEFHSEIGDLKRYRNIPQNNVNIQKFKYSRNPFNHMTVAFRKSIIISAGGYVSMSGYEDYYLWLRVLKNHKGFNIQNNTVYARVGNNMIGRRQGYSFMIKELKFQKQILNDGLISRFQFFVNFFTRVIPRLLPITLLEIIYKFILRK